MSLLKRIKTLWQLSAMEFEVLKGPVHKQKVLMVIDPKQKAIVVDMKDPMDVDLGNEDQQ